MNRNLTLNLLLAGLFLLTFIVPWWLYGSAPALGATLSILLGAVFPLLLMRMVTKRTRNWSGITALVMIPYSVIGVMEVVATLGQLNSGLLLAVVAISNFFLALDAGRRSG